jgi:hypothetical protein
MFIGKPEGRRPLGRPRGRCEDNITIDPQREWKVVGWIHQVLDRNQ